MSSCAVDADCAEGMLCNQGACVETAVSIDGGGCTITTPASAGSCAGWLAALLAIGAGARARVRRR
jgi:hypothetical protein